MTEAHIRQGGQSSRTTFSFDLNGQMTQVACTGQHIDFRYDATGRLIEECLNGQAVAYEYDANGNRLKTRLPSGDSLGYFYYGTKAVPPMPMITPDESQPSLTHRATKQAINTVSTACRQ